MKKLCQALWAYVDNALLLRIREGGTVSTQGRQALQSACFRREGACPLFVLASACAFGYRQPVCGHKKNEERRGGSGGGLLSPARLVLRSSFRIVRQSAVRAGAGSYLASCSLMKASISGMCSSARLSSVSWFLLRTRLCSGYWIL